MQEAITWTMLHGIPEILLGVILSLQEANNPMNWEYMICMAMYLNELGILLIAAVISETSLHPSL
jgi:hypothetical protein